MAGSDRLEEIKQVKAKKEEHKGRKVKRLKVELLKKRKLYTNWSEMKTKRQKSKAQKATKELRKGKKKIPGQWLRCPFRTCQFITTVPIKMALHFSQHPGQKAFLKKIL